MKINKLSVEKGETLEHKNGKWTKNCYLIEIALSENDNIEDARKTAEMLIDAWLREAKRKSTKPNI